MRKYFLNLKKSKTGFTLIETLAYLFISSLLLLLIISLVMNIFHARQQFRAADIVERNARYIMGFMLNKIHNVDLIDSVGIGPDNVYFYNMPERRFNFAIEGNNLVYRETEDTGSGFPEQATAVPQILNNNVVIITNLTLTPMSSGTGQENRGVAISFTISTGSPTDQYGYAQQSFNTFMSIR